ncbi:MAG: hypothetical protein CXZ00_15390 [Acidobacteria bacterium]|nr:MAG: hypothetical protein CXZ00_15390 [Acidobacteriota bacterium]
MRTTNKELKTAVQSWLYGNFPATHVGTLNLEARFRSIPGAANVAERFIKKFNARLWGVNTWKNGKGGKAICVVPVVHDEKYVDDTHLHLALYGFPEKRSEAQIRSCFLDIAEHTYGVQFYRPYERRPLQEIPEEQLMVHFDKVDNSEAWLNYITRKLRGADETILFEHMHNTVFTTTTQQ